MKESAQENEGTRFVTPPSQTRWAARRGVSPLAEISARTDVREFRLRSFRELASFCSVDAERPYDAKRSYVNSSFQPGFAQKTTWKGKNMFGLRIEEKRARKKMTILRVVVVFWWSSEVIWWHVVTVIENQVWRKIRQMCGRGRFLQARVSCSLRLRGPCLLGLPTQPVSFLLIEESFRMFLRNLSGASLRASFHAIRYRKEKILDNGKFLQILSWN